MKLEYYGAKELMSITKRCQSTCYDIIKKLNKEINVLYPNLKTFRGKVPIWYWNEVTKKPNGGEESGNKTI